MSMLQGFRRFFPHFHDSHRGLRKIFARIPEPRGGAALGGSVGGKTLIGHAALARVVEFFDAVGPCVAHSLCDTDATIALLQFPAQQLVKGYGAYVYNQQQSGAPFGDGIFIVNGLETSSRIWSLFPWPHSAN